MITITDKDIKYNWFVNLLCRIPMSITFKKCTFYAIDIDSTIFNKCIFRDCLFRTSISNSQFTDCSMIDNTLPTFEDNILHSTIFIDNEIKNLNNNKFTRSYSRFIIDYVKVYENEIHLYYILNSTKDTNTLSVTNNILN